MRKKSRKVPECIVVIRIVPGYSRNRKILIYYVRSFETPRTRWGAFVMRTFALGSGADRKVVSIDVEGCSVWVIERRPDGGSKKSERQLASEAQADRAGEKMANELINRGFREQTAAAASR